MSADNGIYILATERLTGTEYRVAYCMAIDNVTYDAPPGKFNPKEIVRYFGDCRVFFDETEAKKEANNLASKYPYLEYGVSVLSFSEPFPNWFFRLENAEQ